MFVCWYDGDFDRFPVFSEHIDRFNQWTWSEITSDEFLIYDAS